MLGEPELGIWVWLIAPLLLSYGLAPVPRPYLRRRRLYLGGSIESGSSSVLSPNKRTRWLQPPLQFLEHLSEIYRAQ